MNKSRWWIIGSVVLALGLGIAWAGGMLGEDAKLAEVRQLRDKLMSDEGRQLPDEQRREAWQELREKMQELSPEQREALWEANRQQMSQRFEQRVDEVLQAPPSQRRAVLDRHIDEMDLRRRESEARRAQAQREGGDGGRGPSSSAAATSADGQSSPGMRRSVTEEQRLERRARRLDRTTPEMRAKTTEYFRLLNLRRRERGLPEIERGRGGWGGGRGSSVTTTSTAGAANAR